jgi:hypothetical protein
LSTAYFLGLINKGNVLMDAHGPWLSVVPF